MKTGAQLLVEAATGVPHDAAAASKLLSDQGWDVIDVADGVDLLGAVMHRGTEVHMAVNPDRGKPMVTRSKARAVLEPLMERRGYLTSACREGDEGQDRLLRSIGFSRTWGAAGVNYYMLTARPFERRK